MSLGLVPKSEAGTSVAQAAAGDDEIRRVRLESLVGEMEVMDRRGDPAAIDIRAITRDSRQVGPGSLFCCVVGERVDGHQLAAEAMARGASAVLTQRLLPLEVAQVVVPDVRRAMAVAAAAFFGHPSRRLGVVGVTGTNGKTTTTHLLAAVFDAAGRPSAVIGTLSGVRTTPEAPDLQARLAQLVPGAAVAMEVSSHALSQRRVDATWFTASVFTNLSVDHLDYHGSMDAYFAAKRSLFEPERTGLAVVNADDEHGRILLESARVPTRPYSRRDAAGLEVGRAGSIFRWDGQPVRLRLAGVFNVSNALAAATVARELGVAAGDVAEGLSSVRSVPGRFEMIEKGQPFTVVVDYAHTPAGLEQLLGAARATAPTGRVLVVFGCGGDRDQAKRPAMGEVASRLADLAVLTTDNPRSEDPLSIIEQVRAGVVRPEILLVEPDRRAAIRRALVEAGPGDVVVIAGKGHETVQVMGDRQLRFDDRQVAREELERLGPAGS